jgi:hypothetical protein
MNDIKLARLDTGLSRQQICDMYGIPTRSLQNWENDIAECPSYVHDWLMEKLVKESHVATIKKGFSVMDFHIKGYNIHLYKKELGTLEESDQFFELKDGMVDTKIIDQIKTLEHLGWKIVFED